MTFHKFEPSEIYLQPNDPEEDYYESQIFHSTHWGQRKLGMALIQFLTFYWDPETNPNPIVVYAGAAPGTNISIVSELFPRIQWELYDPNDFDIKANDKIHIHQEYFTDDIAKKWANRNDILFISDIRRSIYTEDSVQIKSELTIWEDMQSQARWYGIMKPIKAQLKFRLPFVSPELSKVFKKYIPYLDGDVFKGIWAPHHSTETRLVPKGYNYVYWDIKKYESQMFYFNTHVRGVKKYLNPFYDGEYGKLPIDPPELLNDYDSISETYVWILYLQKLWGEKEVTLDNVKRMSLLLTYGLNNYNPNKNQWLTIHKKRIETQLYGLKYQKKYAQKQLKNPNLSPERISELQTMINNAQNYDFDTISNVADIIIQYENDPKYKDFTTFILNKLK